MVGESSFSIAWKIQKKGLEGERGIEKERGRVGERERECAKV